MKAVSQEAHFYGGCRSKACFLSKIHFSKIKFLKQYFFQRMHQRHLWLFSPVSQGTQTTQRMIECMMLNSSKDIYLKSIFKEVTSKKKTLKNLRSTQL